jgi:predicted NAD-dependent protein-ADP-ribosyltransferase YbiA (DUF1768 family)
MDRYSSYFIDNKALFGSSPSQEIVNYLESIGVKYFLDLTCEYEKNIDVYKTKFRKLRYPIEDRKIPIDNVSFSSMILKVCKIIKNLQNDDKIYVHCKGGHGRSGVVVACILCIYLKIPAEDALELTNQYHKNRHTMREKWRIIGSPQTHQQKEFVRNLFETLFLNSSSDFFNYSSHSIYIKSLGLFQNSESAYQAYKNPNDIKYILSQVNELNPVNAKILGKSTQLRSDWESVRLNIMFFILKYKFEQHTELKEELMKTALRPIVLCSKKKTFWMNMEHNIFGKLLQKIRNNYLLGV